MGAHVWRRAMDGHTFGKPTFVRSETFTASRGSNAWIGDYEGMAASNGGPIMIFVDNAGAAAHVAIGRRR